MHYLSLIYFVLQRLHVSAMVIAHIRKYSLYIPTKCIVYP
jgi:hypothetical protein